MYRVAIVIPLTSAVKEKDVQPDWMTHATAKTVNFVTTGVNLVHAGVTGDPEVIAQHMNNHRTRSCQIDVTWTTGDLETLRDRCPTESKCETKYRELKSIDRADSFDSSETRDVIASCGSGFWADRFGKLKEELQLRASQSDSDQPENKETDTKNDQSDQPENKETDTKNDQSDQPDKKYQPTDYAGEYLSSHPSLKIYPESPDKEYFGRVVADEINKHRASKNVPPLQWDQAIFEVATLHTLRMAYAQDPMLESRAEGYRNCLIEKTGIGEYFRGNIEYTMVAVLGGLQNMPLEKAQSYGSSYAEQTPDDYNKIGFGFECLGKQSDGIFKCLTSFMIVKVADTPQKLTGYQTNQCPSNPTHCGCGCSGGGCPFKRGGGCPFNRGGGCPFR